MKAFIILLDTLAKNAANHEDKTPEVIFSFISDIRDKLTRVVDDTPLMVAVFLLQLYNLCDCECERPKTINCFCLLLNFTTNNSITTYLLSEKYLQ